MRSCSWSAHFRGNETAPATELPEWIRTTDQPVKSRGGAPVRYVLVDSVDALLWLVDFGCIDFHVWTSRSDRPDRSDYVLFDLDPAGVPFSDVVAVALLLRNTLAAIGLEALVKTTGGEGLHVHVPIERRHTHEQAREFAQILAGALVRSSGGLVTGERSPELRQRVFIDTKMNGHGQQVVAAYSLRPSPGAPVATPLAWTANPQPASAGRCCGARARAHRSYVRPSSGRSP